MEWHDATATQYNTHSPGLRPPVRAVDLVEHARYLRSDYSWCTTYLLDGHRRGRAAEGEASPLLVVETTMVTTDDDGDDDDASSPSYYKMTEA